MFIDYKVAEQTWTRMKAKAGVGVLTTPAENMLRRKRESVATISDCLRCGGSLLPPWISGSSSSHFLGSLFRSPFNTFGSLSYTLGKEAISWGMHEDFITYLCMTFYWPFPALLQPHLFLFHYFYFIKIFSGCFSCYHHNDLLPRLNTQKQF